MFETSPLPPGNYVLRFEQVPQRVQAVPGNRTDNLVSEWRQYVVVPEEDKPLTVDLQLPRDQGELRAIWLQNTLDSRGLPNLRWSFNRNLISSLVQNLDLDADERELLRLYRDPEIPVMWKFRITRKLGETLDSPEVLDALLEKLKPSNHLRDRLMALSALGNATQKTTEIVTAVSSYRQDPEIRIRGVTLTALGRLVERDESLRPTIIPWLITATSDMCDETRAEAVAALGRIKADEAIPALETPIEDPVGKVRVMAAWALWRITGERERPIKLMTIRLRARDHSGKVEAARLLGDFGELPEITIKQLLAHTHSTDTAPYYGEKLLRMQLKRASLATLKKVVPQTLETDGGVSRNAESQKFD